MNRYRYTEIFRSLQGEGTYCGINTAWLRLFACNLQCSGFGQKDPTNPVSYEPVGADLDLTNINTYQDLPIFKYGCDSAYSVSKKYKHLTFHKTIPEIASSIESILTSPNNPLGLFSHAFSHQETHMAFTGGEPLLKINQSAIIELMYEFAKRNNCPSNVTVETNGTQLLTEQFNDMLLKFYIASEFGGLVNDNKKSCEWFWSISPKLFSTSGERWDKAIKPEVVAQYASRSNCGHLKYVVNGSKDSWKEVELATAAFRENGVNFPVYIMPVGATKESQESKNISNICNIALSKGYNISGRLHCYLYGNALGT